MCVVKLWRVRVGALISQYITLSKAGRKGKSIMWMENKVAHQCLFTIACFFVFFFCINIQSLLAFVFV